jgi:hypothetical protein
VGKNEGKHTPPPQEEEDVLTENAAEIHVGQWRTIRQDNPYRFAERTYTGRDKLFCTKNQAQMWIDFYHDSDHMKKGFYVVPKYLNLDHFSLHTTTDFRFIDDALKRLNILDVVCIEKDLLLLPDVIRPVPCHCVLSLRSCSHYHLDDWQG